MLVPGDLPLCIVQEFFIVRHVRAFYKKKIAGIPKPKLSGMAPLVAAEVAICSWLSTREAAIGPSFDHVLVIELPRPVGSCPIIVHAHSFQPGNLRMLHSPMNNPAGESPTEAMT